MSVALESLGEPPGTAVGRYLGISDQRPGRTLLQPGLDGLKIRHAADRNCVRTETPGDRGDVRVREGDGTEIDGWTTPDSSPAPE